jgi:phosphatidylglycerophosphate synthase
MTSDKVFMCALLIVLAAVGRSPAWAAWIITSRELLVLFLRVVASSRGRAMPIAMFGKLKTFMIYLLVPLALAGLSRGAVLFLAVAASLSALGSLIEYAVKMRHDLVAEFFHLDETWTRL